MSEKEAKLIISAKYIEALSAFAATRDVRFYLNGFYAEPHPDGGVFLVATNGHIIIVIHDKDAKKCNGPIIYPLPPELVREAKKKTAESVSFSLSAAAIKDLGGSLRLQMPIEPIDGQYPDWRKVAKQAIDVDRVEHAPFCMDPKYIAVTSKLLPFGNVCMSPSKSEEPVVFWCDGSDHIWGLIMPCRSRRNLLDFVPDWLGVVPQTKKRATKKKAKAKAA